MADTARILVADDDAAILDVYAELLSRAGHEVHTAIDGTAATSLVRERDFDLVLTDLVFPPTDGIRVLEEVKRLRPSTPVVVFSGGATVVSVLAAFRGGALDFLVKPVEPQALFRLVERVLRLRRMGAARREVVEQLENERSRVVELSRLLGEQDPFRRLIGASRSLERLIDACREVARTDSTVLLTGESGTGKGLVARTIHEASARRSGPFVEANCVVYSEGVLHSELFGHEQGAFTGAARAKRGRFEMATGGTLFLDEIGEISPATQLLLLRVLQERTYERVGGEETLEADLRLIAATNRDLHQAMADGAFRSDLFYRLNVIPIHLPPLRERADDVPVLAQHFLRASTGRIGREVAGFAEDAMEALVRYRWPGNVRELENVVERVVVLARGSRVELADLPPQLRAEASQDGQGAPHTLRDLERRRIVEVLRGCNGNKKLAAQRLGIHRSTLYAKLRRYGLLEAPAGDGAESCRGAQQEAS